MVELEAVKVLDRRQVLGLGVGAAVGAVVGEEWHPDPVTTSVTMRGAVDLECFDITRYGARVDGATDDTAAWNAAIAAIVAAGRGQLCMPAGASKVVGPLSALTVPIQVKGAGAGNYDPAGTGGFVSRVLFPQGDSSLFTVNSHYALFRDLTMLNTAAATPTAGAAIAVTSAFANQQVDYRNIVVRGFFDNIDVDVGAQWKMEACGLYAPVRYGLAIDNTVNEDAGDWSISNSYFISSETVAGGLAGIHIQGSGGGKIENCKVNAGGAGAHPFTNGIELHVPAGVVTSDLLISNSSIENIGNNAFDVTTGVGGSWNNIVCQGLQTNLNNTVGAAVSIVCNAAGDITGVIISGVFLAGAIANPGSAIILTNVDACQIGEAPFPNFGSLVTRVGGANNFKVTLAAI